KEIELQKERDLKELAYQQIKKLETQLDQKSNELSALQLQGAGDSSELMKKNLEQINVQSKQIQEQQSKIAELQKENESLLRQFKELEKEYKDIKDIETKQREALRKSQLSVDELQLKLNNVE